MKKTGKTPALILILALNLALCSCNPEGVSSRDYRDMLLSGAEVLSKDQSAEKTEEINEENTKEEKPDEVREEIPEESGLSLKDGEEPPAEELPAEEETFEVPESTGETWTIMLYLCGTDLESNSNIASINLSEIVTPDLSENTNFIINTGGTKTWHTPGISSDALGYYHVEDNSLFLDKEEALRSMGDPSTLTDFITYASKEYPADKYMLILWDHGGGSLSGVCEDELYDKDTLTVSELNTAVKEAGVFFDIVGFDACLMANIETAEALMENAGLFIGSEEIEPGLGWDYVSLIEYLKENPVTDNIAFSKDIADKYLEKCRATGMEQLATLSVTDLTKLPALSDAFRDYSGRLVLATENPDEFKTVARGAVRSINFGGNTWREGYSDMVDLSDLASRTKAVTGKSSQKVIDAVKDAVLYEVHGENRKETCGLSVFYPLHIDESIYSSYKEICKNTAYLEYVSIIGNAWDMEEWTEKWQETYADAGREKEPESFYGYSYSIETLNKFISLEPILSGDYRLAFSTGLNDENKLVLNIDSGLEILRSVNFELYSFDKKTGKYLYLGTDNNLKGDYLEGWFEDNFLGFWFKIGDEFVCAELIEEGKDHNFYSIPVILNGIGTNLRAVYDYNTDEYRILGAYKGIDLYSGQSSREVIPLSPGDSINFVFHTFDSRNRTDTEMASRPVIWSEDFRMRDERLGNGRFLYMYKVADIFGNVTYGEPVYMDIEGDTIKVSDTK